MIRTLLMQDSQNHIKQNGDTTLARSPLLAYSRALYQHRFTNLRVVLLISVQAAAAQFRTGSSLIADFVMNP